MWFWWAGMMALGFGLGCVAAWTQNAARVLMKTIALPLALLAVRLCLAPYAPPAGNIGLYFLDFVLLGIAAFIGDYLLGLRLGRHGADGYREDSVSH
jgi:hypothetical protein